VTFRPGTNPDDAQTVLKTTRDSILNNPEISERTRQALANPRLRQQFADLGQDIPPPQRQTIEALAAFQKAEIEKWQPLMKLAKQKTD